MLAFVDEQRRFTREERQRARADQEAARERKAELDANLKRIREEEAAKREELEAQFRLEQAERRRQAQQQLQDLRDQAAAERQQAFVAFAQRLADLNANLLGERRCATCTTARWRPTWARS
ncbi:MAG: hypothetical protein M5R40_06605 [Anaerolineae bacterium]|nr:hypothetical protein [Anaerolineae bacterium]